MPDAASGRGNSADKLIEKCLDTFNIFVERPVDAYATSSCSSWCFFPRTCRPESLNVHPYSPGPPGRLLAAGRSTQGGRTNQNNQSATILILLVLLILLPMEHSPVNYWVSLSTLDSPEHQETHLHSPHVPYSLKSLIFGWKRGWNLGYMVGSKMKSTSKIRMMADW